MICATTPAVDIDTCQGDGGSNVSIFLGAYNSSDNGYPDRILMIRTIDGLSIFFVKGIYPMCMVDSSTKEHFEELKFVKLRICSVNFSGRLCGPLCSKYGLHCLARWS
jgi:hypothetical protein